MHFFLLFLSQLKVKYSFPGLALYMVSLMRGLWECTFGGIEKGSNHALFSWLKTFTSL